MRWSTPELLSDAQVARIQRRQKECGLTSEQFLGRFKEALKEITGVVQSHSAVKMRLDRVFYSRMRRRLSETTKLALAHTLGWTLLEFEKAIAGENGDRRRDSGDHGPESRRLKGAVCESRHLRPEK